MKIYKPLLITLICSICFCTSYAQQQLGQIVINAGYGYSPEFDGDIGIGGTAYPAIINPSGINADNYPYPLANFNSVSYNKGAAIDVGFYDGFSIGLAASYQSEVVNWQFGSDNGVAPTPYQLYDKVTRTNFALRLLHHSQANTHFDFYYGARTGISFWQDSPYPVNTTYYQNPVGVGPRVTFLKASTINVPSFQVLCGLRYFPVPFLGIQVEAGIGSPYLAEAGLTFRINTIKVSSQTDAK